MEWLGPRSLLQKGWEKQGRDTPSPPSESENYRPPIFIESDTGSAEGRRVPKAIVTLDESQEEEMMDETPEAVTEIHSTMIK